MLGPRARGVLLLLALMAAWAPAQDRPAAEAFVDLQGATHQPLDTRGTRAVVLLFISTDCPIANYYATEINALVKDNLKRPVRFFLIHADPELTPEAARKHAATYGFPCPVLIDRKHRLVKAAGVTVTPEAAVFTPDGKVAYRGRIDDTYADLGKRRVAPNRRDLRDALTAILAGRPVAEARTTALGCPIPDLP